MEWSPRGYNEYLERGWIDVGPWCLRSEIYPAGAGVRDRGVGGCDYASSSYTTLGAHHTLTGLPGLFPCLNHCINFSSPKICNRGV